MMDQKDLSLVRIRYRIPKDYEIELSRPDSRIDNPPPDRLGVYEEAFETRLGFPLPPFVLELLKSYEIPLCVLTLNSTRFIIRFLGICFLDEIQPSLPLFRYFFTVQRHPYAKVWWYLMAQKRIEPLNSGIPSAIKGWKEHFYLSSPSMGD